ncbi:MAG: hypothetical protein ACLQBB_05405 [Solirubrobacteraceae bacterium]
MRSALDRIAISGTARRALPRGIAAGLAAGALMFAASAGATGTQTVPGSSSTAKPVVAATLDQCVTTGAQAERAATFAGEMSALPGTAKMEMRIDVLERLPDETTFHTIVFAGLGVWRTAAPGVKTYKYLKEVTNLAAPADYRAAVRFRWLNSKGKLMKALEMRTPRCVQPAPAVEEAPPQA